MEMTSVVCGENVYLPVRARYQDGTLYKEGYVTLTVSGIAYFAWPGNDADDRQAALNALQELADDPAVFGMLKGLVVSNVEVMINLIKDP